MLKKSLSLLLAIVLCFSLFPPISAFATGETLTFTLNQDAKAVIDGYDDMSIGTANYSKGFTKSLSNGYIVLVFWIANYDTDNYVFKGWKINGTLYNTSISLNSFDGFTDNSGNNWGDPSRIIISSPMPGNYEIGPTLILDGIASKSIEIEAIFDRKATSTKSLDVTCDLSKGSVDKNNLGGDNWQLTATPNLNYALGYWEYAEGLDATDGFAKVPDSDGKKNLMVTIEQDMTYRAVFSPTRFIFIGGPDLTVVDHVFGRTNNANLSYLSSMPEEEVQMGSKKPTVDDVLGNYHAQLQYRPSDIRAVIGEPARLLIPWMFNGDLRFRDDSNYEGIPLAFYRTVRFKLFEGADITGVPLIDSEPRVLTAGLGPSGIIYANVCYDVYFNFIMPAAEQLTVWIQLDDQEPVVMTYDTGFDASLMNRLADLDTKYNTPENIKWRYLIKDAIKEASASAIGITDSGEIDALVQAT